MASSACLCNYFVFYNRDWSAHIVGVWGGGVGITKPAAAPEEKEFLYFP